MLLCSVTMNKQKTISAELQYSRYLNMWASVEFRGHLANKARIARVEIMNDLVANHSRRTALHRIHTSSLAIHKSTAEL